MKRRYFLQLAGAAAAGAMCVKASHASAPGNLLHPDRPLVISSWLDEDEVIHLMLENPHHESTQNLEVSRLQTGRRYKVRLMNATNRDMSLQLPRNSTNKIRLERYSVVEADLVL